MTYRVFVFKKKKKLAKGGRSWMERGSRRGFTFYGGNGGRRGQQSSQLNQSFILSLSLFGIPFRAEDEMLQI